MISSRIWFRAAWWRGRLRRPVSRAARMPPQALRAGDTPILGAGALAVPQLQLCDRGAGGVGGEAGQPHAVGVGEAQLGSGVGPFLAGDQSHPLRPACEDVACEFGDPGAVADGAVRFDGRSPGRGGHQQDGLVDRLRDGHPDRVGQPPTPCCEPVEELVGAAAGVGAYEGPPSAPVLLRQLGQGQTSGGDVVGGGVATRVAGPQQAGDRLSGSFTAVVDEREQRVVAEGLLPGRGGVFFLGVRQDQHAVDVHDHIVVRVRCGLAGRPPDPIADFGPCPPDGCQCAGAGCGKGVDQSGDRRIGGHRSEHAGLRSQHGHVRQAVPARGHGKREIQQDLAGVMHRPGLAPRRERHRQPGGQARAARCLHQQDPAGLRDDPATATRHPHTRVRPDTLTHLGSASDGRGNKGLDNPHSRSSEALSALPITHRTAPFVKARG